MGSSPVAKRARTEVACKPWTPPVPCTPGAPFTATPEMVRRMLSVIEKEVLPKTAKGVDKGNKVFGAAILDGRDAENVPTVIADTNHETLCPMYHGEIYTIKQWSEKIPASERPAPADSIFVSTHEPCCMCISAIVWTGFKKVCYL